MSGYRNEWPCCGDETYTQAWEPERCPFCEVAELEGQLQQARARVAELERKRNSGEKANGQETEKAQSE